VIGAPGAGTSRMCCEIYRGRLLSPPLPSDPRRRLRAASLCSASLNRRLSFGRGYCYATPPNLSLNATAWASVSNRKTRSNVAPSSSGSDDFWRASRIPGAAKPVPPLLLLVEQVVKLITEKVLSGRSRAVRARGLRLDTVGCPFSEDDQGLSRSPFRHRAEGEAGGGCRWLTFYRRSAREHWPFERGGIPPPRPYLSHMPT
jgi:hypothetical protein